MQSIETLRYVEQVLGSLQEFSGKVKLVHDEDELIQGAVSGTPVHVGVIYEGIRGADGDIAKNTHKVGISKELRFSVCLLYRQDKLTQVDMLATSIKYLERARSVLLDTRAPNNHFFNFNEELGGKIDKGLVVWLQRWSLPVQILRKSC